MKNKAKKESILAVTPPRLKQSMRVRSSNVPQVKKMKLDGRGKMLVSYSVRGLNKDYENPKEYNADIEIDNVKIVGNSWGKHLKDGGKNVK